MKPALALALLLIGSAARADVYVLGSSYSNDALPRFLDDRPQWHIDCGKPLQYIFDNPQAPCELASTIWPVALATTQFHHVSFQPVKGAGITEQSDINTISYWLSLQPAAAAVIHATWPIPSEWESAFHDPVPDNTLTNYSQRYAYDLLDKLQTANPGRHIVTDRANEILDSIYHDIENGVGPLTDFRQLFRDESGHMSEYGQYLQHNVLRQAFGQRAGTDHSTGGIPQPVRTYFDTKIRAYRPDSTRPHFDANALCRLPNATCATLPPEICALEGGLSLAVDLVVQLRFDSRSLMTWFAASTINGPFAVYRGTLGHGPWSFDQTCLRSTVSQPSVTVPANPSVGGGFYYLVTVRDPCGESSPGYESSGDERPISNSCP